MAIHGRMQHNGECSETCAPPSARGYSRRALITASAKGFPGDTLFRLIAGRARQTIHICRRQSISPDMMYDNMAVAGGEPSNRTRVTSLLVNFRAEIPRSIRARSILSCFFASLAATRIYRSTISRLSLSREEQTSASPSHPVANGPPEEGWTKSPRALDITSLASATATVLRILSEIPLFPKEVI